jgi:hypothetical protein
MSRPHHYKEPRIGSWHADYGTFTGHPLDPRTDPDAGLQPCLECNATGEIDEEPCPFCSGKAYFLDDEPCSAEEFQSLTEDRYHY